MNQHPDGPILSAYLDEELDASETTRVRQHEALCSRCREELTSLRGVKDLLAAAQRRTMPEGLAARLESMIHRRSVWEIVLARLSMPRVWVPVGTLAAAAAALLFWLGPSFGPDPDAIPLETLLAAHARYEAESLVPSGDLLHVPFSAHVAKTDEED
jgi:anti-sigma factor RsiW